MSPRPIETTLVISFKAGGAVGKHYVKVCPRKPSGQSMNAFEYPVLFEGEDRGVGIVAQMSFTVEEEGLYWIDIEFLESVVTRIPLRVIYQRAAQTALPGM